MIVGLTGGIGSGKSVVAKLLKMLGCAVFNSDEAAKECYRDPDVKNAVVALLGNRSYLNDGNVDRSYIASRLFSDQQLLASINAIIHPAVKKKTVLFANENKGKIIVKESALLFETGLNKEMDKIIVVTAPKALRLARAASRDGFTQEQVLARMDRQWAQEKKDQLADFLLVNDECTLLIPQVLEVHRQLMAM